MNKNSTTSSKVRRPTVTRLSQITLTPFQRRQQIEVVAPVLKVMVAALLTEKPEDPIPQMMQSLQEANKLSEPALTFEEREELIKLRLEYKKLRDERSNGTPGAPQAADSSSDDDDDYFEDDEVGDLTSAQIQEAQMNRQSVSAEVYGKFNFRGAQELPVIEKSEEERDRISRRLDTCLMFSNLDDGDKEKVIAAIDKEIVPAGKKIIIEDEAGEELYIVESGRFSCYKFIEGKQTLLKYYEPGEVFGELALLYNAPRAASIKAEEESFLWKLGRTTFNSIVKDAAVKRTERYKDFLKHVHILESLNKFERSKLADLLKEKAVPKGGFIIKQDQPALNFYFLLSGMAMATKNSKPEKSVMNYEAGDYFGELALLKDKPRAANVVATSDCRVLTLDRHSFQRILGPMEEILKRNMKNYESYLGH